MLGKWICFWLLWLAWSTVCAADEQSAAQSKTTPTDHRILDQFIESHCVDCHDEATKTAGLAFDDLVAGRHEAKHEVWEKVVRKLTARQMPPKDSPRPTERDYDAVVVLAGIVARHVPPPAHPNPGRTETFRRLNRTEYQNTIRDLLALDVDVDCAVAGG